MAKYIVKALVPDDEGGTTVVKSKIHSWSLHGAVGEFYKQAKLHIGHDIISLTVTKEGQER